jgi:hypothetical protein
MHWVAGGLYVFATTWALAFWRKPGTLLLQLCFWVTVIIVTLLPGKQVWDPFWWASVAIIPSVTFAGVYVDRIVSRHQYALYPTLVLLTWLLIRTIHEQLTHYCFPGA